MNLQPPYRPQEVSEVDLAFPARVAHLMPDADAIPEDFWRDRGPARPWIEFQREWFFWGIDLSDMRPRKGIDKQTALRHLLAIQMSFEPKHEYKEAAVAYLSSLWFENPPGGGS